MNTLSGYTEIKLPNGEIIPLKYGMWAFRELCRKWNVPLKDVHPEMMRRLEDDMISLCFDLLGTAAEYASKASGNSKTFDEAIVSGWIDDTGGINGSPVIAQVMDAFAEALGIGSVPESIEPGNTPAPQGGA